MSDAATSQDDMTLKPPPPLWAWLRSNPVTLKELRGRMRGMRAFIVITVYVLLMSLFTVLLYAIYSSNNQMTLSTTGGVLGKLIFGGVLTVELFLVCFIAPAFTAGSISGERERRTFYLLRTTLLSADKLILGKLISALAFILLLLVVAIPLQSLAFLMGGISLSEVLLSIELLVVTGMAYGAVGIFFSAITRRTLTASILTYSIALLMTVALPLVALTFFSFVAIWLLSPLANQPAIEAVVFIAFGLLACTNPLATAVLTELAIQQGGSPFIYVQTFSNGASMTLPSPWIVYTVLYVILTIVLVRMSVNSVRRVDT
jgi:ABC-type transport system involved in multi-copper enzyme maturation permease subunit